MNVRACVLVVEFSIRWKVNRAEKIEQEKMVKGRKRY